MCRQVRAAAEVLPGHAAVAAEVVVDGQLAAADLGARAVRRRVAGRALEADQLELVRLVRELGARLVVGDARRRNVWPLLDDRGIASPAPRSSGVNGLDVEVVVEAVGDRRPDAEPGLRVHALDRLGGDVRGGVPQDVQAVGAVDGDRLDVRALGSARCRSRSSPLTRATTTVRSSPNRSRPLVVLSVTSSVRSPPLLRVIDMEDTRVSLDRGFDADIRLSAVVMVPARHDQDLVALDPVDQPVLVSDPPRPVALELVTQRLRLPDLVVPIAFDVPKEHVDPPENLAVLRLPPR